MAGKKRYAKYKPENTIRIKLNKKTIHTTNSMILKLFCMVFPSDYLGNMFLTLSRPLDNKDFFCLRIL